MPALRVHARSALHGAGCCLAAALVFLSSTSARGGDASAEAAATSRPEAEPGPIRAADVPRWIETWRDEGTAAGSDGDWYDNRDGGHSKLDLTRFPGLRAVEPPDSEKAVGLQVRVLPRITIGNSSTASSKIQFGSNVRTAYVHPRAMRALYSQYRRNNLYVYPEHRDHDPARGDLLPLNCPYLVCSQGSSGSDRKFLEAAAYTLAAFRPEVKRKLARTGLLMPTVQMLLRRSYKPARRIPQYLTGAAHPSAFHPSKLDVATMVRLAHRIRPGDIPPLAKLEVVKEQPAPAPVDGKREVLCTTPCAVARVWRHRARQRTITLDAGRSFDVNRRELTYHWAVLRGAQGTIEVARKNDSGSLVEITLAYPKRRPIERGSELLSSRVDVACFVHNGVWYSAPAFVTYYGLPQTERIYNDEGELVEIRRRKDVVVDPRL